MAVELIARSNFMSRSDSPPVSFSKGFKWLYDAGEGNATFISDFEKHPGRQGRINVTGIVSHQPIDTNVALPSPAS